MSSHLIAYPVLSFDQIERIRTRLNQDPQLSGSSVPCCPRGILEGRTDLMCDCSPIKNDPEYSLAGHVCATSLPCPVREVIRRAEKT